MHKFWFYVMCKTLYTLLCVRHHSFCLLKLVQIKYPTFYSHKSFDFISRSNKLPFFALEKSFLILLQLACDWSRPMILSGSTSHDSFIVSDIFMQSEPFNYPSLSAVHEMSMKKTLEWNSHDSNEVAD